MPPLSAADLDERIFAAIRALPVGVIASYGGIGRQIGLARGARRVARALAGNTDPSLPWHRVLRAGGVIAFPADTAAFVEQARRLRAEGHQLRGARVLTAVTLDAALWNLDAPPDG